MHGWMMEQEEETQVRTCRVEDNICKKKDDPVMLKLRDLTRLERNSCARP